MIIVKNIALVASIILMFVFTYYVFKEDVINMIWSGVWFIILTMDYYHQT